MAPLLVEIVATLSARWFVGWRDAARIGVAVMFLFTAASHFSSLKYDLAAMIPPPLTGTLWVIYVTGVLEAAGAIGLLVPRLRTAAAVGLVALLIALFPANVYAAMTGATIGGATATPLSFRTPLQLFWIGMLWRTAVSPRRTTRSLVDEVRHVSDWTLHRRRVHDEASPAPRGPMQRRLVIIMAAIAAVAVFAGLVHAVLVAAHVSEPAATTVYGVTPRRLWAAAVAGVAVVGLGVGGLALARPSSRFGVASGPLGANIATVMGVFAAINGGLNVAIANGGPGTGNGVVGGAAAFVLGLLGAAIGSVALARSRR